MDADRIKAVTALLVRAEKAHGVFEASVLKDVYDQGWPRWYASYAVDHGLGDLFGHAVTVEQLAPLLSSTYVEFSQTEPNPTVSWATYAARRISDDL